MGEYFAAQVVHYPLAHRLQDDALSILNGKCSDAGQKKYQRYEKDSPVGARAKAKSHRHSFEPKAEHAWRLRGVRRKKQIDSGLCQGRPGQRERSTCDCKNECSDRGCLVRFKTPKGPSHQPKIIRFAESLFFVV